MEEKPLQSLVTHCEFTICDEISSGHGKLITFLTNTLKFKISGVDPLVIEKDCPSPDDLYKLLDALKDLQRSQNRKNYKSHEHPRDSPELEQKKGNIPCDSSVQTSSLLSLNEDRQLTDWSIVNNCEINSSYKVASQQAQGSNDDVNDLSKIFQDLKVKDVSSDYDHVAKQKDFANNLNGNTLQELTSIPLEHENGSIALLKNVIGAKKQKDCQDVEDEKKQIQKPQPEYFRNQGANNLCGNTLRELTNVPLEPENESIALLENVIGAEKQKDCQDVEEEKKQIQTPQPEYFRNQGANNLNGNTLRELTKVPLEPENESIALLENVIGAEKQKDCQDVGKEKKQIEKPQPEYLRNQGSVAEHSSADVQIIKNTTTATENLMKCSRSHKQTQDGQYIGQIDSRKKGYNCTVIADDNHDILNQEHLSKHQDFDSRDIQFSTFKDGRNKRKILKQGDMGTSKILSSNDSSDSDAESQHDIVYSIKASSLDGIKMYFKGVCNDKYFDDVETDGTSFTFKLRNSCEEDVSFLSKLKKIKVEECKFDHQDNISSAVKDIESQNRDMIVYIKDNKVQIVGLKDSVLSAKKKLQDMITNDKSTVTRMESLEKNSQYTLKNQDKSRISDDNKTDKPGRSQKFEDNEMPLSHDLYNPSSSPLEYRNRKLNADKTTYSGDSKYDIFSENYGIYYVRNERMQLKVNISNADITKLAVDCIVNAANKKLQHFGGVAKVISQAAGPALKKECEDFTLFGRQVDVTDIFVSTGGEIPAKWVMHAVGPKWDAYENKTQCFEDLRHTVVRCLVEADRRGFTSIAIPSISAAIFKVPKQECARCYMEAVKHFGLFKEQTSLRDIQFVDVDDTMVKIIQEHFQRNWTKSCDPYIVQKDCDFAKGHIYTGNRNVAKNIEKFSSSSSMSTKTPGASKASSDLASRLPIGSTVASPSEMRTGRHSAYLIGTFTLRTDTRPAFNLPSDITITVGKPFDKLSGLHDFSVSSHQKQKESVKNIYKIYEVSKPKSSQPRKLCALLPEPDDADTIKQSIGNLETIIQSPNHKKFMETVKNVVLTSSILYGEPYNTQKKDKKHTWDRKKVGHFARCVFDCLQRASGLAALKITLVGSEDALPFICEVLESRGVKKISPEASTSSYHGGSSRKGDNSDHQQSYSRRNLEEKQYDDEASTSSYQGGGSRRGDNSDHQQSYSRRNLEEKRCDNEANSSSQLGATSRSSTSGDNSDRQQTNSSQYARSLSDDKQYASKNAGSSVDLECEICFEQKPVYPNRCCGKYLCQDCEKKMASCPFCRKFWRVLFGNQPPGTMDVHVLRDYASGYESFHVLEIKYSFPPGLQKACHPNPGDYYKGINRIAYLPSNTDGLKVLKLLRIAFLRRLTFTIGHSLTTDRENSIIWNDIHHKTSLHGGAYGYPDPSYFLRVMQELASKGVTFETMSADERLDINYFSSCIQNFGFFNDVCPR